MKEKSLPELLEILIPLVKQVPQETQIKMLWVLFEGIATEMEQLKIIHDATIKGVTGFMKEWTERQEKHGEFAAEISEKLIKMTKEL